MQAGSRWSGTDGLSPYQDNKREQKNITISKNTSPILPFVQTTLRTEEALVTESHAKTDIFDQTS